MFFANRSLLYGALALAAAVAGCSSTDQSVNPTGLRSAPKGPHRTEIGIGNIALCKVAGPPGTYHFHIDVAGGGDFTLGAGADPTIVFTGDPSCINTAYTTVDNATWAVPGTTAAVTITETQIPAGVTVDSIEVTDESGDVTSTVLNNPLVIIVEGPQDLHTVLFFNAALPSVTCTAISAVINVPLPGTQLTATGGSGAPYTFTATGLPPGVSISSSGLITGTPTASGSFTYTVTVTDKKGHSATSSGCALTVGDTPTATCVTITAVKNVPITPVTLVGSGGTGGAYTFSATGLPAGLTMSAGGTISGTPTVSGTFNYTVTVADKDGHTGTVNCSVTVNPPPTANCVTINAVQNTGITPVTMVGSGGSGGPYTFSATGLPAGLTMSSSGTISGTPTVSGTFSYTVTVTDKDGHSGTVNCSVTVNPPPTADCVTITAVEGTPITPVTMIGAGGNGGPYTFSAVGLPAGLTMSSSGTISGTPTVSGTFIYTVTVMDKDGNSSTVNCSVTVDNPPCPAGAFTFSYNLAGDLLIKYDQFPAPNDNSYGVNAVGWGTHGHKFTDLVGSDHAGFQLVDPSNVVKLSFNIDYISASTTAPSGYASLVTGGDGSMLVGTADGISATSSLANNLNNINIPGLFNPTTHVQQFGSVNVLSNSPPTDAGHLTYNNSDPLLAGWDFHDTYYVTISAAKLASLGFNPLTWKVQPNLAVLHNSPAKACPTGGTTGGSGVVEQTTTISGKEIKISIQNNGTTDVFLTDASINWPTSPNGKLMQLKVGAAIAYDKPDIAGGSATMSVSSTTNPLVGDQNKRKIPHGKAVVIDFVFEKNVDTNLAHYVATLIFSGQSITVLP